MGEKYKWEMPTQLIISAVTSNQKDGNITNPGATISTGGHHGRRWSNYYAGLNARLGQLKRC